MSAIKVGVIGGSGLGNALAARGGGRRHELDTPFGRPSDAILEAEWSGLPVLFLSRHGPGHLLGPSQVPFRANIFALKQLGCTHVIASGAVGSLRDEFKPRDLVVPDQIIDRTVSRPGTFFERSAVHVEFAEPFCPVLRRILLEGASGGSDKSGPGAQSAAGDALPFKVHDRGCYVCMEGPAFSTRAESLMHRLWGGDLIGMTAMPEAKLAREAEMSYALVALVTDYDAWRKPPAAKPAAGPAAAATGAAPAAEADPSTVLMEIIANLQTASENAVQLVERAVRRLSETGDQLARSTAHEALKLAIWSDKSLVPTDEVERLGPLWMKYFGREPAAP